MKKTIAVLLVLLFAAGLAACGGGQPEETTAEPTEPAVYNGPTLEEMSPPSMPTAAPITMPDTWKAVDKSDFKPIKLEDSLAPQLEAKTVYKSGDNEYFIMKDGDVYALCRGETEGELYSAYYSTEGAFLFLSDEERSWFYKDGAFDYMTYTYTVNSYTKVVSFYEGENTRFAVYAGNTYYDGELNELTDEQQVKLVIRVAAAFSMMGGMDKL